ncbi:hypothetical protein [Arcobacter sp. FWKO B]|uniref:hypothetical protein n=1 Tax=Arcobacter sp. FWKO B TaxID=2593672 RepID=UPI0018A418E9|nr:hypothetical protein [Arcobacter sp. FWKO B]QOG11496.1 hypothetical protein FWKOB_01770 [Arcobacter sp. FWKO B]
MNNKQWTFRVLVFTFLGVVVIVAFNYLINPYNVFNHDYLTKYNSVKNQLVNDEMSKFYSAKRQNPDVLLVGSSRVEHIHPKYLQQYENGKIYNVSVKGSGLSTQFQLIQYFVTRGNVKTVVLGLDFYAFSPINIGEYKNIKFTRYDDFYYDDYLNSLFGFRTLRKSISTFKDNIKGIDGRIEWDSGWDTYSHEYPLIYNNTDEWYFNKIDSIFPNFGINDKFFANEEFKNPLSINNGLMILSEIVTLCKNYDVKLILFTTPLYHKVYDVIHDRGYDKTYTYWKNELSKYNMVYDFNYKNSITSDYRNYVDPSHFKSDVGKYIFAKIYHDKSLIVDDFGKILTVE